MEEKEKDRESKKAENKENENSAQKKSEINSQLNSLLNTPGPLKAVAKYPRDTTVNFFKEKVRENFK